ncbi:MAG: hypothetical protein Q4C55_02760 [Eubacterium sp.]|nr:hypothetical protein [Eubacterium sp.]
MVEYSIFAGLAALVATLGIAAVLVAVAIPAILYCLSSYGLYVMAVNKKADYPWLAWIPIVKLYLLGEIIDERVCFGSLALPYAQVILPIASVFGTVIVAIPFVGWVCSLAIMVYSLAAYFRLYKLYAPESAVLYLVLSIILPFMLSIFPFAIRNRQPVEYYL